MRRGLGLALAVYLACLAAFALLVALPFIGEERAISAGVPSPPPLVATSLANVPGKSRLCMTDVTLPAQAEQMRFKVGTYFLPGPSLAVTVDSPAYRARSRIAAGYPDNSTLSVDLPRPNADQLVTVCIRNVGRRRIALYAAADSARSRVQGFVNGKPLRPSPLLSFHERGTASFAERAGVVADRIAVFRGFLDQSWVVWALAIGALLAVPLLLGAALVSSSRSAAGSAARTRASSIASR